MTRLSRTLVLLLPLALSAPAFAQREDVEQGVDLLSRGRKQEALEAFQRALAAGLTQEEAYDVWKSTDSRVWVDMMMEGGEYELVARRLIDLASLGEKERENDPEAVQASIVELKGATSAIERQRAIRKLAADHGEYAVPYLLRALGDQNDEDWRITAMNALTAMDTDVLPPLVKALDGGSAFQRRNVAIVLGRVGDPRAAGPLLAVAGTDEDGGVRSAAEEAARMLGAGGDAMGLLLQLGDDLHHRRDNVLRPHDYSDVVWTMEGDQLVPLETPRAIYNNALSLDAYDRALRLQPDSEEALAGLARAWAEISDKLERLTEAGGDAVDVDAEALEEWNARAAEGSVIVSLAGAGALDTALQWSVLADDTPAGVRLARALARTSNQATEGLVAALISDDGGLSSEAAVALGNIAWSAGRAADPQVVQRLSEAAGREIVRIAALIDAELGRANTLREALTAGGVLVNHRDKGAAGLAMLRRLPGVDVILVGNALPDLTLDQVLSQVRADPSTAETPIFLVTSDETTADLYSGRVDGTISDPADLSPLDPVFEAGFGGDRARADELSQRAAEVIARLAQAGHTDVSGALGPLAHSLSRRDEVAIASMSALEAAGTPAQVPDLLTVVTDSARSEEARIAAAEALGAIFARHPGGEDHSGALRDVVTSDSPLPVRQAAARALGRLRLAPDFRGELIDILQSRKPMGASE